MPSQNWGELLLGQGKTVLDVFLEPTCPNSARAFGKLKSLVERAGEDKLTVRITIHSQPWHLFSSVVSRAILAATLLPQGSGKAMRVIEAVYANREAYVCTDHCRGSNMDLSPDGVLGHISGHSGMDLSEAFERKEATDLMKRHAKYARQNGIHASPTFMINGLVNDKMGSRDEVGAWLKTLELSEQ